MGHARVRELRIRVEGPFDEAAEIGGGGRAVEAMVVIEDAYQHAVTEAENLTACLKMNEKAMGKMPMPRQAAGSTALYLRQAAIFNPGQA